MKQKISLLVLGILLVGSLGFISAQENVSVESKLEMKSAGTIPGSIFYGLDKALDRIRYNLARGEEKKSRVGLEIAEERISEAKELASRGKFDLSEKARVQHEKYLNKIEERIQEMELEENVNESEAYLRAMARIQLNFEKHQEKVEEAKARFLENHGENLTEEELAKAEEIFSKLENKSERLKQKSLEKRERAEVKYRVLANLTEEELENLSVVIDKDEGLGEFRENKTQRSEQRFQRSIEVRERNLERLKESLNSSNITEEKRIQLEARVQNEEQKFEEFRYRKESLQNELDTRFEAEQRRAELREKNQEELRQRVESEIEKRQRQAENDSRENSVNISAEEKIVERFEETSNEPELRR